MENSNDIIGNRTRDLPTCSAVLQPTQPPRAPLQYEGICYRLLRQFVRSYFLFTHKTVKTECEQKGPGLTWKLTLQKHFNCRCTGKGMLIWFPFGHMGQRFIAGIVKRFAQCHVFAQSPPDLHPNDKYPVNTSHHSRFVLKCFTHCVVLWQQHFVYSMCADGYVQAYVHTCSSQYRDPGLSKEVKSWVALNATCEINLSASHFGHSWHRFVSHALESCMYFKITIAFALSSKNEQISSMGIFFVGSDITSL